MKAVHIAWRHRHEDTRIFQRECLGLNKHCFDIVYLVQSDSAPIGSSEDVKREFVEVSEGQKYHQYIKIIKGIVDKCKKLDADIYHIHEPELVPVGIILKTSGKKIIYDAHEMTFHQKWDAKIPLWQKLPETVGAVLFEKTASCLFDGIVAATPRIKENFPDGKSVTVMNFPKLDIVNDIGDIPYGERENNVVYVGGITQIRGIKEMVEAISLLPDHLDVRLQLAGEFNTKNLQAEVAAMDGWEKVNFHGWISRKQVFELFANSKIGLAPLHKVNRHKESIPNKLFEYMAAGLPVVASDFKNWEEFIKNPPCGRSTDPTDPYEIAEQIEWMLENEKHAKLMGENAKEMVKSEYNWESQEEKLVEFYYNL